METWLLLLSCGCIVEHNIQPLNGMECPTHKVHVWVSESDWNGYEHGFTKKYPRAI